MPTSFRIPSPRKCCSYLDLDEIRLSDTNEIGVALNFIVIPRLDDSQTVYRALALTGDGFVAREEGTI